MEPHNNHKRDELLELLWHLDERHELTQEALKEHDPAGEFFGILREIQGQDIVRLEGDSITLTERGRVLAREITRSRRLAERLMTDVLGPGIGEVASAACEFEHVLAPELVDSICTLLGHPRFCPHGNPIPKGRCCSEMKDTVTSIVLPLTELKAGETTKVAFINTKDSVRLQRLLAMGLNPGSEVRLLQKYPALVIELDQCQVALEESIGEEIKVWRPAGATEVK